MLKKRKEGSKGKSAKTPRNKGESKWTMEKIKCPEGDYEARLLLEWDEEGKGTLKGISCDNPRFAGLDNWDCTWSCWEKMKIAKKK